MAVVSCGKCSGGNSPGLSCLWFCGGSSPGVGCSVESFSGGSCPGRSCSNGSYLSQSCPDIVWVRSRPGWELSRVEVVQGIVVRMEVFRLTQISYGGISYDYE